MAKIYATVAKNLEKISKLKNFQMAYLMQMLAMFSRVTIANVANVLVSKIRIVCKYFSKKSKICIFLSKRSKNRNLPRWAKITFLGLFSQVCENAFANILARVSKNHFLRFLEQFEPKNLDAQIFANFVQNHD